MYVDHFASSYKCFVKYWCEPEDYCSERMKPLNVPRINMTRVVYLEILIYICFDYAKINISLLRLNVRIHMVFTI